jgi:hypothetical protein
MILKELEDFARQYNIKPQSVKINAASTFPVRAKCRFCMKGPTHYFAQKLPVKWYNPKRIKELFDAASKYFKRMSQDFYLIEKPTAFTGIAAFSCYPVYKSYNPALHTKRGIPAFDDVIECLACYCGRTTWGFAQKSIVYRPDILFRKARYKYPVKFDDWF